MDLGFGRRSLARRFHQAGLRNGPIDALLLTHGHSDHAGGAAAFAGETGAPVFMTEGTRQELPALSQIERRENIVPDRAFTIGDLQIEPFPVPHDSLEPVGFRFSSGGISGALVTDAGELLPHVSGRLAGCDWLILESNHDEELVRVGPYPWRVKERVLSRLGHLSNRALCRFLQQEFDGCASHIFLAHLSRTNNDPELALEMATQALSARSRPWLAGGHLHLTHQGKPSIVLDL